MKCQLVQALIFTAKKNSNRLDANLKSTASFSPFLMCSMQLCGGSKSVEKRRDDKTRALTHNGTSAGQNLELPCNHHKIMLIIMKVAGQKFWHEIYRKSPCSHQGFLTPKHSLLDQCFVKIIQFHKGQKVNNSLSLSLLFQLVPFFRESLEKERGRHEWFNVITYLLWAINVKAFLRAEPRCLS